MGENTDEAGEHEWSLIIDVSGAGSMLAAGWVRGLVKKTIRYKKKNPPPGHGLSSDLLPR